MKSSFFLFLALLIFPVSSALSEEETRTTFVISDLHLGLGKKQDGSGDWYETEDFRWPKALTAFLEKISEYNEFNDLVIAGDFIEMWQPPPDIACKGPDKNHSCSVSELEQLVTRITSAHPSVFNAFSRFAAVTGNCIYVVAGNHDAALLIDNVWNIVKRAMSQEQGCIVRAPAGVWASASNEYIVEHGHQMGKDANRYDDWPIVTATIDGVEYIERPWGEKFVQDEFNRVEIEYQLIDNLKPKSAGMRYRAADQGLNGTAKDYARFLKFNIFSTSWKQKFQSLGEEDDTVVEWDTDKGRGMGFMLYANALPYDDPFREQLISGDGEWRELRVELDRQVKDNEQTTDEEIEAFCDRLAELRVEDRCVETKAGALFEGLFSSRTRVVKKHLNKRAEENPNMSVFSYGHTHSFEIGRDVKLSAGNKVNVTNSGAFQRLIDDDWLKEIARERSLSTAEVLRVVKLEDLPACYTFVQIDNDEGAPYARVRAWIKEENDDPGTFANPCGHLCPNVGHNCE